MIINELIFIALFVTIPDTFAFITLEMPSLEPLIDNRLLRARKTTLIGSEANVLIPKRRSPRLIELDAAKRTDADSLDEPLLRKRNNKRGSVGDIDGTPVDSHATKRRRRNATNVVETKEKCSSDAIESSASNTTILTKKSGIAVKTLPRTLEESIRSQNPQVQFVLGIDEAGRGPLAGPVVVAAVRMTNDHPVVVEGVTDSKKITAEAQREALYEQLIESMRDDASARNSTKDYESSCTYNVLWAIAVIDAATIDKINILQATLLGMELVASAIMERAIDYPIVEDTNQTDITKHSGCFVVVGRSHPVEQQPNNNGCDKDPLSSASEAVTEDSSTSSSISKYYALIDGNRFPKYIACPAVAIIKGDSREYCIAAASILAKVTRDRIMHRYHAQYPEYNFAQHKGYPTAAHVQAIREHGPSPIHRMSFAPLKKSSKAAKK